VAKEKAKREAKRDTNAEDLLSINLQAAASMVRLLSQTSEHHDPADMSDGIVPTDFRIWIGRAEGPHWHARLTRHSATIAIPPVIQPSISPKNIQTITFGIGPLFVFAVSTIAPGLDLDELIEIKKALVRLWPSDIPSIDWPLPDGISDPSAQRVSAWMDQLIAQPNVKWRASL
jgi:hypothetical protein